MYVSSVKFTSWLPGSIVQRSPAVTTYAAVPTTEPWMMIHVIVFSVEV